jgi:hydroxymethylglutaryl-CoA lyase
MGGLGGCPFAQDALIGNIPTEVVIDALAKRGVELLKRDSLDRVLEMNRAIEAEFSGDH